MGKPATIRLGDVVYIATVFQITERDPDGTPRMLKMLGEKEQVALEGGEAFLIAYVNKKMLRTPQGDIS